jgi:peptidoglycan hydrolase FlgJ
MNVSQIRPAALDRAATVSSPEEKLKKVAQQLEGAFVEQLFKAMRETVPEGGIASGGSGEEIFSSMMDQHLAAEVPANWESGIGSALVRQLRGALSGGGQGEAK